MPPAKTDEGGPDTFSLQMFAAFHLRRTNCKITTYQYVAISQYGGEGELIFSAL